MTTFITSDIHINHVNLAAKWRLGDGFDGTVETHNATIKARWNAVVGITDTVIVVGDAVMGKRQEGLDWFASNLNGRKALIPGNHDHIHSMHGARADKARGMYAEVFEILDERVKIDNGRFVICHFPWSHVKDHDEEGTRDVIAQYGPVMADAPEDQVVIHGHTHSSHRASERAIHVGVDSWDYTPISLDAIRSMHTEAMAFPE